MLCTHAEPIAGGLRLELSDAGARLSFRELFERLEDDADFADAYTRALVEAPLAAFFWEHPPLTQTTLDSASELVLIESAALARLRADPQPFAERFAHEPDADVITFPNLGGDALLVVPTPRAEPHAYPQLAAFVRGAPPAQVRAIWQAVGRVVREHVGDVPRWLSTAGMGVSWLHLRLDSRPKYYRHTPYKRAP